MLCFLQFISKAIVDASHVSSGRSLLCSIVYRTVWGGRWFVYINQYSALPDILTWRCNISWSNIYIFISAVSLWWWKIGQNWNVHHPYIAKQIATEHTLLLLWKCFHGEGLLKIQNNMYIFCFHFYCVRGDVKLLLCTCKNIWKDTHIAALIFKCCLIFWITVSYFSK